MKNEVLFCFLVLFLYFTSVNAQKWRVQNSGVKSNLNKIYFIDSLHGWAVGERGALLRTTDGGNVWTRGQSQDSSEAYVSTYFTDSLNGWVVALYKYILRTKDGGKSWMQVNAPTAKSMHDIYFSNPDTGWIVGGVMMSGVILVTLDGGNSWSIQRDSSKGGSLYSVRFVSEKEGWAVGFNGRDNHDPSVIYHTTDAGHSWEMQQSEHTGGLLAVSFYGSKYGWATGAQWTSHVTMIIKTIDSGHNWYFTGDWNGIANPNDALVSIVSVDSLIVLIGSSDERSPNIYRTKDGGNLWSRDSIESPTYIASISCINSANCWACGGAGRIWKFEPSLLSIQGPMHLKSDEPQVLISVTQRQATMHVEYTLRKPGSIAAELINLSGIRLDSKFVPFMNIGSYSISFDVSNNPAGVYFIHSYVGNNKYVNKYFYYK